MRVALPVVLLAACGGDPSTTVGASATEGGTATTTAPMTDGVTTGTASEVPTGGSGGATDSGTTTTGSSSETTEAASESGSTSPVSMSSSGPEGSTSTGVAMESSSDSGSETSSSSGSEGSTSTGDETTTGGVEACACPDLEVPLDDGIFVLSDTAELWKYFPMGNNFLLLGEIGCDIPPPTFSMAVDRLGFAWVEYPNGQLRKVAVGDVTDCSNPGYVAGQQGVQNFGMAFVSNSEADKCDRIYGNEYLGFPTSTFFSVDPMSLMLQPIGETQSWVAEVTGTGDGRAFLFTVTNPPALVEIDKLDGSIVSTTPLPNVEIGSGLAFAFYGGDFYFFTDAQLDNTSEVTHMDYDDSDMNGQQDLVQVFNNAPLRILGAGVSTCVPFAPQ